MKLKTGRNCPGLHNQLVDLLHDVGMEQMVLEPTRRTDHVENTLDLVITNTPQLIPRVEVVPGLSDHDVVYFEYKARVIPKNTRKKPFPIYGKADWDAMKRDMIALIVEVEAMARTDASAQALWLKFKEAILHSIKTHVPHKKRGAKPDSFPWISYDIKKMIRSRDRLYAKKVKTGDEDLKVKVRNMNRDIQKALRRAHWNYVNGLFAKKKDEANNTHRMKRFWTYINRL